MQSYYITGLSLPGEMFVFDLDSVEQTHESIVWMNLGSV